jgi:hypothetical protein
MAINEYSITTSDGKTSYKIPANQTNLDTSITLIGHGMPNYGEQQNENFLHLLENFAKNEQPNNPIVGQLWYYKDDENKKYELRVCRVASTENSVWDTLSIVYNVAPTFPKTGDIWYDEISHELKVYDDKLDEWNIIGPIDVIHTDKNFIPTSINTGDKNTSITIPYSDLDIDVNNFEDGDPRNSGCLCLVTIKILAKEVVLNYDTIYDKYEPKCCVWIYRFVINSYKEVVNDISTYTRKIIGYPTYELLAKTDETDWSVDVIEGSEGFEIKVTDNSSITNDNITIVVGYEKEVVKV